MPLFKPILRPDDLPPIGAAREALAVDFKRDRYDFGKRFEMAKDAAAFANATGGVVLVGADEDQGRKLLVAYNPIADETVAADQREAISKAIRDRCAPAPLIDPQIITHPAGGYIVAINVWPFPAQAVGVRVSGDKKAEGYGGDAYVFPIRIGIDTQFLRPEQLPMLMVPALRTTAILLDALRPGDLVWVVDERGMIPGGDVIRFVSADAQACCFTVKITERGEVTIPLDAVRSVWRSGSQWKIAIQGRWGKDSDYYRTATIPGQG
jgi:hypothetical protein